MKKSLFSLYLHFVIKIFCLLSPSATPDCLTSDQETSISCSSLLVWEVLSFLCVFFHQLIYQIHMCIYVLPLLLTQQHVSCSVICNFCNPTRLLCPWVSPGKNPGVGGHSLLQEIFLTQGMNLDPVSPKLIYLLRASVPTS